MNFIHEFKVLKLTKRSNVGPLENVIVHCRWQLTSYREDYPDIKKISECATPFTINLQDLEGNFISFEDLAEQDVISWIESNSKPAIISIKKQHKNDINEKIEHVDEVIENPWESTEEQINN